MRMVVSIIELRKMMLGPRSPKLRETNLVPCVTVRVIGPIIIKKIISSERLERRAMVKVVRRTASTQMVMVVL